MRARGRGPEAQQRNLVFQLQNRSELCVLGEANANCEVATYEVAVPGAVSKHVDTTTPLGGARKRRYVVPLPSFVVESYCPQECLSRTWSLPHTSWTQ